MTRHDILALYDRVRADAERKLVTDLLLSGHDDGEIAAIMSAAQKMHDSGRVEFVAWLERTTDEAVRWLHGLDDETPHDEGSRH